MGVASFEDIDPVFSDVVSEMFGDAIDPRELWDVISKQNDASEMHVPTGITLKEKQRRKRQAQVGLASNIVGIGAGLAALGAAAKDDRFKAGGRVGRAYHRVGTKLPNITPKTGAAGAAVATGALGLQVANVAGDMVANRVLNREAKKKLPTDSVYRKEIKKALDDILDARRRGVISTDRAIELADNLISKVEESDAKAIHQQAEALVDSPLLPKKAQYALKAANTASKAKPKMQQTANKVKDKTPALPSLTWQGNISKRDDEHRQVFGFCTVTHVNGEPVIDRQGDYVPLEEIEKAAYTYVVESRKGGDMHQRNGEHPLHTSDMIESVIITPEKLESWGLDKDAMPYGWWVGFKVNDDEQWEKVKKGERPAFSIHGSGKRVEKML
jgi:hypothetical protein